MDLNSMQGADRDSPASDEDDAAAPVTRAEFKQLLAAMHAQRSSDTTKHLVSKSQFRRRFRHVLSK